MPTSRVSFYICKCFFLSKSHFIEDRCRKDLYVTSLLHLRVIYFKLRLYFLVKAKWSGWSAWSGCSKSCGTSGRTRKRTCSQKAVRKKSLPCSGKSSQNSLCHGKPCPGNVDVYFNWFYIFVTVVVAYVLTGSIFS